MALARCTRLPLAWGAPALATRGLKDWREGLGEAVRERGLEPMGYDAPAAAAFSAAEQAKWLAIAAAAGVQPE